MKELKYVTIHNNTVYCIQNFVEAKYLPHIYLLTLHLYLLAWRKSILYEDWAHSLPNKILLLKQSLLLDVLDLIIPIIILV